MTSPFQAPIVPTALLKRAAASSSTPPWIARRATAPSVPWQKQSRVHVVFDYGKSDFIANLIRSSLPSGYKNITGIKPDVLRELLTSIAYGWFFSDINDLQVVEFDDNDIGITQDCIYVGGNPLSAKVGYYCPDATDPASFATNSELAATYAKRAYEFIAGLNSGYQQKKIDTSTALSMIRLPWREFPWFMPGSFWSWFSTVGSKWDNIPWGQVLAGVNALKAQSPGIDFSANQPKNRPKWGAQDWNKKLEPLPATGQTGPYPTNIPWDAFWSDIPLDIFPSLDKWSNNAGSFYLWEKGDGTLVTSPEQLVTNFKRLKNLKDSAPAQPPPLFFNPLPKPPVLSYLPGINFDDKGKGDPSKGGSNPGSSGCLNGTVPDPINPSKCITVEQAKQRRLELTSRCAQKGQVPDFATGLCKPSDGRPREDDGRPREDSGPPVQTGCQPPNVTDPFRGDCIAPEEQQKRLLAAQACTQNGGTYDVTTGNCVPKKADAPPAEEKKSNTGVILGVLAVLGVAAVGIAVAMKKPDGSEAVVST